MCGEKTVYINSGGGDVGSPPHVRGKEIIRPEKGDYRRITPACAGKSARVSNGC